MKNTKINFQKKENNAVYSYAAMTREELENNAPEELMAVYTLIPEVQQELKNEMSNLLTSSGYNELETKLKSLDNLKVILKDAITNSDLLEDGSTVFFTSNTTEEQEITDEETGEVTKQTVYVPEKERKFVTVTNYVINDDANYYELLNYLLHNNFRYGLKISTISLQDTDEISYDNDDIISLLDDLYHLNPYFVDKIFKIDATKFKGFIQMYPDIKQRMLDDGYLVAVKETKESVITNADRNLFNQEDFDEINVDIVAPLPEAPQEPEDIGEVTFHPTNEEVEAIVDSIPTPFTVEAVNGLLQTAVNLRDSISIDSSLPSYIDSSVTAESSESPTPADEEIQITISDDDIEDDVTPTAANNYEGLPF